MPTITGTAGDDALSGTAEVDTILGLGGNDTITAGLGDSVDGGDGVDSLTLDLRNATFRINFGPGYATAQGINVYSGLLSNIEIISALYLPDQEINYVSLLNPNSSYGGTIYGGALIDQLLGSNGADTIHGGNGDDTLQGAAGDDSLFGDAGDDFISGGPGHDVIDGGAGVDTVTFWQASGGVTVDLAAGMATDGIDRNHTLISIENAWGTDWSDTLLGNDGANSLIGGDGADLISGLDGNDELAGNEGEDVLIGGNGNDRLYSGEYFGYEIPAAIDYLDGGSGDDYLHFGIGDTAKGGDGLDVGALTLVGTGSGSSVNIGSLLAGVAGANGGGTVSGIEQFNVIYGSAFDDVIDLGGATLVTIGTSSGGVFYGTYAGIFAGRGNDIVIGGPGSDSINGGPGADQLYGGGGNDYYYVDSQADLVFENPGEGADTIIASSSFYLYANVEILSLEGSAGNAFAVGNDLANRIDGNAGNNLLLGGGGNDVIWTGGGNDVVYGEDGNDQLSGWDGIDYLIGGAGNDSLGGANNSDALYGEDGDDQLYGGQDFATDIMVGGAGNDILSANSGLGDYDILNGGAGNDVYYVDTPADIIYEGVDEGRDTVIADINGAGYYLWANVEDCTLVGDTPFAAGNDLDNWLIGSELSNWLLGNGGNDILNGKQGNDVLFGDLPGGNGHDTFTFQANCGQDVIGDFHHGEDTILLIGYYANFAAVSSHFVQNGNDGAIDLGGGNIIVLPGVDMATLTAIDFIFN